MGSFFLRNTGMSPSQLNFLLKMTEKRILQNQQALLVKLKLWRRRASLRKRMRRIYLQLLKRGDSPGREGVAFFRSAQQRPQNWTDPGTLQVLSLATAAKEEVEVYEWEWAELGSFTRLYLSWIILLTTTELGFPFPCLREKILLTSFNFHFCEDRKRGW